MIHRLIGFPRKRRLFFEYITGFLLFILLTRSANLRHHSGPERAKYIPALENEIYRIESYSPFEDPLSCLLPIMSDNSLMAWSHVLRALQKSPFVTDEQRLMEENRTVTDQDINPISKNNSIGLTTLLVDVTMMKVCFD